VFGSSRVVGMAGAFTALAAGIDGATVNAAAPAVREPFSFDWFDWDLDVDASLPGAYGGTDFDNRGPDADPQTKAIVNGFLYAHAGAQVQLGQLGASGTAEFFQYAVHPSKGTSGVTLVYGRYHALVGYGLLDNQLIVGGGLRIVTLQVKSDGSSLTSGQTLLTLDGAGPEAGAVFKPNGLPFRLGTTVRSSVGASVAGVVGQVGGIFGGGGTPEASGQLQEAGGFVLPSRATLPWELETGFAFQLGPSPINPPWLDPHEMEREVRTRIARARASRASEDEREAAATPPADRAATRRAQLERERVLEHVEDEELAAESSRLRAIRVAREGNWPRERITVLGSLLITGASSNAVSLEGFTTKTQEFVGRNVSLTPRVGIESEPVSNWVHGRVGTYLEPSRFDDGTVRQHFTFGADVKLFKFSPFGIFGDQVWRLNLSADLAPRYQNFGLGFGAWH
jgi:hypothetical protein